MAEDGVISAKLANSTSSHRGVNTTTLTFFTLLSMVCVFFGESFEVILNYTIFLDCIGMATAAGALFLIDSEVRPKFRQMATAAVFIISYVFIAISIYISDPKAALYGLLLLALVIGIKVLHDSIRTRFSRI